MIPLKLSVKNFMCYRDNVPTLDLDGIHLACLCGDNGHGKTALLDAITWVLWGQARARTHELVHQGQQDMAVELEFLARGLRHRVIRKYSVSTQSPRLLELQVASDNGYRAITGNTVRETEAQIRNLLHMDYDTFVNTAFLLQSQADKFSTSKPAERKNILAEVIDLSYYATLEERAKQRVRNIQDSMRDTDSAVSLRQQEIAGKPEYEAKLDSARSEVDRVSAGAADQRRKVEELRGAVDSLQSRRNELKLLNERLTTSQGEISDLERQMQGNAQRVGDYEAVLQREAEIRDQFGRLEKSRSELERMDQAAFQASSLSQAEADLKKEVAVQRERLSGLAAPLRDRITRELEPRVKRLPEIEEGLRIINLEHTKLEEEEESLRRQQSEAQEVSARVRYLEEANDALKSEMEATRKKFDMLDENEAVCPLCKQPLGPEGQGHLRREYEDQGQEAKVKYQQQETELDTLGRQHKELLEQTAQQEADLNGRRKQVQTTIATHERDLAESRKAHSELEPARSELEQLEIRIKEEDFAQDERLRLSEIEAELAATGYDNEQHQQTRERVKGLDPFAELHRKLLEATEALPTEREALETASQMLDRRRQEGEQDEKRRQELGRDLEALSGLESRLAEAQSLHGVLERQQQEAVVQQRVLAEQLEEIARKEAQLRALRQERDKLAEEKAIYDELAVAFGKNGIQALIIETAIPQLQNDANELLSRLTEGRLSIKLQLQEGRRERRLGLPSEELQILISDDVGTRSYETFSGGEAFRIDFALRIALSKLLARRSGVPLPILFMDEGFGGQDSAGQERLKEAIQSIQSDFQKIIVITHVEDVKDAFPTRIEVTKTGSGSTFVVV